MTWICALLNDLHQLHLQAKHIFCDNQTVIHKTSNPIYHEKTKHIKLDCHVREKIQDGSLVTLHVASIH